jgi:hypothetical protein
MEHSDDRIPGQVFSPSKVCVQFAYILSFVILLEQSSDRALYRVYSATKSRVTVVYIWSLTFFWGTVIIMKLAQY